MIFEDDFELRQRIRDLAGRHLQGPLSVTDDASDYLAVDAGAVLRLDGSDYFVLGEAKEERWGISEEPKFWVKHAVDLTSGARKIIKFVFHERFTSRAGQYRLRCVRSHSKESEVLRRVAGDERFMQGTTVADRTGNPVRLIDYIDGPSLFNYVIGIPGSHQRYYHDRLPDILRRLAGCVRAIGSLHRDQLQHGDVRTDHILVEEGTGTYRWIDFDFRVDFADYDLLSLGAVLNFAVAKGVVTMRDPRIGVVAEGDALLLQPYRLANLRRAFPYLHPALNDLLMSFSTGVDPSFAGFDELAGRIEGVADKVWGE